MHLYVHVVFQECEGLRQQYHVLRMLAAMPSGSTSVFLQLDRHPNHPSAPPLRSLFPTLANVLRHEPLAGKPAANYLNAVVRSVCPSFRSAPETSAGVLSGTQAFLCRESSRWCPDVWSSTSIVSENALLHAGYSNLNVVNRVEPDGAAYDAPFGP